MNAIETIKGLPFGFAFNTKGQRTLKLRYSHVNAERFISALGTELRTKVLRFDTVKATFVAIVLDPASPGWVNVDMAKGYVAFKEDCSK